MNPSKLKRLNAPLNQVEVSVCRPSGVAQKALSNSEPVSGTDQLGLPALYALPDILRRGKFSKSFLYVMLSKEQFPQPVLRMGPRFTRWSAAQVDSWLADPQGWQAAHAPAQAM